MLTMYVYTNLSDAVKLQTLKQRLEHWIAYIRMIIHTYTHVCLGA